MSRINEDIIELNESQKENIEKFHKQDLMIQENKIRFETIDKKDKKENKSK